MQESLQGHQEHRKARRCPHCREDTAKLTRFLLLALVAAGLVPWVALSGGTSDFKDKQDGVDLSPSIFGTGRKDPYALYRAW